MSKKNFLNLQMYAPPTGETMAADLAPAISIDYTSRIAANIQTLQDLLGITSMTPMAAGTLIKLYKWTVTVAEQVAEGETIGLSKAKRELAGTIELGLGKYRRQTTAEAIQSVGQELAINQADEQLVAEVRGGVKSRFFTAIAAGTGTADGGPTLQAALASVWKAMQRYYVDKDVTPVYFVSSDDVADYLGTASVTVQTAFGFSYIENFLGLGTVIINPGLTAGEVYGTVKENLNGAYVPASGGDLAQAFGLVSDTTGFVGMTHLPVSGNASIDTLLFCSVVFYPEFVDGVFKGEIAAAEEEGTEETQPGTEETQPGGA